MSEELGDRLKKLREKHGLTQKDAAKKFGITNYQLFRYENNKANPDPDLIAKFARYYEVTTDFLLSLTDDPKIRQEDEEEMMFAYGGFDTEGMTEDEIEYMKKWTKEELEKYREAKKQWEEMRRLYEDDDD